MKQLSLFLIGLSLCFPCFGQVTESFEYHQDFAPVGGHVFSQHDRLVFEDVREEGRLSSWKRASWQLFKGNVKVVNSRIKEWKRREKSVKKTYDGGPSYVTLRGYRAPWFTLSMGETCWKDYVVETSVTPADEKVAGEYATTGVAFRYQNPRQYYAFMLEKTDRASLYFRPHDREASEQHEAWLQLESVPFTVRPGTTYPIKIEVTGDHIACFVDGRQLIDHTDDSLSHGRVALLADNPATFGPVHVQGTLKRKDPGPLPPCAHPKLVHELELPEANGDRRFFFFDVDSDDELEVIVADLNELDFRDQPPGLFDNTFCCLEFDGTELWRIEGVRYPRGDENGPVLGVFDINGDGANELILPVDLEIQVREGTTGKLIAKTQAPEPNPYFGDKRYPYERLLVDALYPVRLDPDDPPGFYVKDDYTNLWVYDHNLDLKWHQAVNTGHWPRPVDINGDGTEEILCSHTLLDSEGNVIWDHPKLSDHQDKILYTTLNPDAKPTRFYVAHGEVGLLEIEPRDGRLLFRSELGHVQDVNIGDFLPDRPGRELLTETTWREGRIHYLFDRDLNMVAFWESGRGSFPIKWGKNGRALVLSRDGILDPLTGRIVIHSLGTLINVMDQGFTTLSDPRFGDNLVIVQDAGSLKIFAPEW